MKNTRLGPLPAAPATGRALSPSRAALLEALRGRSEAAGLADLAAETGLHRNTVREHLDALVGQGLVERRQAPAKGRGRPAWLYRATLGPQAAAGNEYAGLATALAALVQQTSDSPTADAETAGFDWGRRLAARAGAPADETPLATRRQVTEIFDRMGFAPQPDEDAVEVRLTRCPLLEAAQESPAVVCGVHLGIVRGATMEYHHDGSASELYPFAEPGACVLRLVADEAGD